MRLVGVDLGVGGDDVDEEGCTIWCLVGYELGDGIVEVMTSAAEVGVANEFGVVVVELIDEIGETSGCAMNT